MPTIDGSAVLGQYRTTASAVRLLGNFPSGIDLTACIETAHAMTDRVEECAGVGTLTFAQLELIERWLSAHYTAIIYPVVTSKSALGASESYQRGGVGTGLESTPFGIQAMRIDPSGCLEKIERGTASVTWLGTDD